MKEIPKFQLKRRRRASACKHEVVVRGQSQGDGGRLQWVAHGDRRSWNPHCPRARHTDWSHNQGHLATVCRDESQDKDVCREREGAGRTDGVKEKVLRYICE